MVAFQLSKQMKKLAQGENWLQLSLSTKKRADGKFSNSCRNDSASLVIVIEASKAVSIKPKTGTFP
jgi:hypothetical protein